MIQLQATGPKTWKADDDDYINTLSKQSQVFHFLIFANFFRFLKVSSIQKVVNEIYVILLSLFCSVRVIQFSPYSS
jgi:hypothetical protein